MVKAKIGTWLCSPPGRVLHEYLRLTSKIIRHCRELHQHPDTGRSIFRPSCRYQLCSEEHSRPMPGTTVKTGGHHSWTGGRVVSPVEASPAIELPFLAHITTPIVLWLVMISRPGPVDGNRAVKINQGEKSKDSWILTEYQQSFLPMTAGEKSSA